MLGNRRSGYGSLGISLLSFLLSVSVHGQQIRSNTFGKELRLSLSNDNFWPPFYDRYFTNGLTIGFSKALDSQGILKNLIPTEYRKSIIHFKIGQELYTPKKISERDVLKFDRPYAAYLYIETLLDTFWKYKHNFELSLSLGVIGPKARGEQVQSWWHKILKLDKPRGWDYQIGNEPVVNLGMQYRRLWLAFSRFDLSSTMKARVGTAFDDVSFGLITRFGKLNPIDRSAITNSILNNDYSSEMSEWFVFGEFSNSVVFHNTLIEGSLLHPSDSEHIEETRAQYFTSKAGIAFSKPGFSWMFNLHWLTPEVIGAERHTYASIELTVRF